MRYVVRYEIVGPEQAGRLPEVYPRHKAYVEAFEAQWPDVVIGIGTFEQPAVNGSMAVFATREAAERFLAGDPFVVEGLARPTPVLGWAADVEPEASAQARS